MRILSIYAKSEGGILYFNEQMNGIIIISGTKFTNILSTNGGIFSVNFLGNANI